MNFVVAPSPLIDQHVEYLTGGVAMTVQPAFPDKLFTTS
jgi:hypothetical protein